MIGFWYGNDKALKKRRNIEKRQCLQKKNAPNSDTKNTLILVNTALNRLTKSQKHTGFETRWDFLRQKSGKMRLNETNQPVQSQNPIQDKYYKNNIIATINNS